MRNRERRSPNETQQTLLRPLEECSQILNEITAMCLRLGKPMSAERMDQLLKDLAPYPVEAISWALESWGRNAKTIPALSDLLQLLRTWHAENEAEQKCDCSHLHGTGYGIEDIRWLMEKRGQHAERFSIVQWEALFAELDAKRPGGAPEFRKNPETRDFLRAE